MIKNQKGILAFDFLVGFMIITSFFMLLAMLSFTLSVVESMQYIAFATARTYYAADVNEGVQKDAAEDKYDQFKDTSLKGLLRDDWFDMQGPVFSDPYGNDKAGVRIDFTAKVLSFTLPFFLGKTGESNSFKSNVNAYIGREISQAECMGDLERRGSMIINLNDSYRYYYDEGSYIAIGDNGC